MELKDSLIDININNTSVVTLIRLLSTVVVMLALTV